MKVAGIGLPKTGTTSLHKALQILGYDSIHCPLTWEEMTAHEAATDSAVALWYRRIYEEFPDCKFIKTHRNIFSWLDSCRVHFSRPAPSTPFLKLRKGLFGAELFDEFKWREARHVHSHGVDDFQCLHNLRILHFSVEDGDGWDRLCKFLDKPIPDVAFPHENKRSPERYPAGVKQG